MVELDVGTMHGHVLGATCHFHMHTGSEFMRDGEGSSQAITWDPWVQPTTQDSKGYAGLDSQGYPQGHYDDSHTSGSQDFDHFHSQGAGSLQAYSQTHCDDSHAGGSEDFNHFYTKGVSDCVAIVSKQEHLVLEEHIQMSEEGLFDYSENENKVEHKGHQSGSEHVSPNDAEQQEDSPVQDNFHEQLNKRLIEKSCDSTASELQSVGLEDRIWRLENILNDIKKAKLYGMSGQNLEM